MVPVRLIDAVTPAARGGGVRRQEPPLKLASPPSAHRGDSGLATNGRAVGDRISLPQRLDEAHNHVQQPGNLGSTMKIFRVICFAALAIFSLFAACPALATLFVFH